jgi:putative FmdB family regulatory protein
MTPIYEFKCPVCSTNAEVKAAVDESIVYPSCQYCLISMDRVWTAPPAHFKGTGWGKD